MNPVIAGVVVAAILGAGAMSAASREEHPPSKHESSRTYDRPISRGSHLQNELYTKNLIQAQNDYLENIFNEITRSPYHKVTDWIHIVFPSNEIGYVTLAKESNQQIEYIESKINVTTDTASMFIEKLNPLWYDILVFIQKHPTVITKPSDLKVVEKFYIFWSEYHHKPLKLKQIIEELKKAGIGIEHTGGRRRTRKLR
jgi:hypothetical protein